MPPRFAYWTILAGGLPTSFRAADKDELMPTFRRLKEKHPDAEMKYFARGKLWNSAEEARRTPTGESRGRDWRPGGEHRDPRQRFKDAKAQRNQDRRKQRWSRKNQDQTKPHGDPLMPRRDRRPPLEGSRHGRSQGREPLFRRGPKKPFDMRRRGERNEERPPRPPSPEREPPPPQREPPPEPPPRPSEPAIKPPGPPERGREPKGNRRPRKGRRED
jgi:hypothetical protein